MSRSVNHGGDDDIAPVIPLFGSAHIAAPADNAWVRESAPEPPATDSSGWWIDADDDVNRVDDEEYARECDEQERQAGIADALRAESAERGEVDGIRPLSSAKSVASRDDETGSRLRHPASKPTLMRASDLAKPVEERSAPIEVPTGDAGETGVAAGSTPTETSPRDPSPAAQTSRAAQTKRTAQTKRMAPRLRVIESTEVGEAPEPSLEEQREKAEIALVKKLRGRGLSVSEARSYLRGLGFDDVVQNETVDLCVARGYLDDAVLAEQLVYAGSTRKGQGRRAISLALSQRGIDRSVIESALAELPDDDAERALEFARTKAKSLSRLDHEVAMRRLMGQLARRGFGGSVARDAAQEALREVAGPRFR